MNACCKEIHRHLVKYRDAVQHGGKLRAEINELKELAENNYDAGYEQGFRDGEAQHSYDDGYEQGYRDCEIQRGNDE